jgi:membrane-associated protease RseP (regulator of RpoE activity)
MNDSGKTDSDSLASKNFWQQSAVILAGVVMNFLFAFVIFTALFMVGIEPLGINSKFQTSTETKLIPSFEEAIRVGLIKTDGILLSPMTGSIAAKSGILDGDILLSINGKNITKPDEMIAQVKQSSAALSFTVRGTG